MNKHTHLIGIGGIGMSCIAKLLLRQGVTVSGSDLKESNITNELKSSGAQIYIGHSAGNIWGADMLVYSSAVKDDNPEVVEAKRRGVPLIKRAQALAQLMEDKVAITVTGSHGKTTTSSLISILLTDAGFMPTAAVGGIVRNFDTNACAGEGQFFVAEADESDGSFLYYRPKYSVITNIDYEHLDYYHDFQNVLNTFKEFINHTRQDGCLFCCDDDPNLKNLLEGCKSRHVLFGMTQKADIYPMNIRLHGLSSEFDVYSKGEFVDRFFLALGGMHNISNSMAVIALGLELGISREIIKKTLSGYKGAGRRIEIKYQDKDLMVIDDYAHHPTEIKATLAAVKNLDSKRIIVVFQPHRYSRTKLLLDEFGRSFDLADVVIITDIYAASERPIEGVSGRSIYERIKEHSQTKEAMFLPKEEIVEQVLGMIKPGDLVIVLGAGDIIKICDELVERLKRQD